MLLNITSATSKIFIISSTMEYLKMVVFIIILKPSLATKMINMVMIPMKM